MKIKVFEAHDRLLHFKKDQDSSIQQGVEDCLKKNFDSVFYQERSPYIYIFAHPRTDDDGTTKRMLWQPRLLKPKAQTNSYLFRVLSNTDVVEPIWMLPPRELWPQYAKGKVTENEIVNWSIDRFINNRVEMEKPDPEDLPEERCKHLLNELIEVKRQNRKNDEFLLKLNEFKPKTSEESSTS